MTRVLSIIAITLASILNAWADTPAPLKNVGDVLSLSVAEAKQGRPVELEATTTFYRAHSRNLYVQDGTNGIFVKTYRMEKLEPGTRVRIKGKTSWGYRANVEATEVTVIGHNKMPKAVPARFNELFKGKLNGLLVTVRGTVRAADPDAPSADHTPSATLRVHIDGGNVDATVLTNDANALEQLLDAKVEIKGVVGGRFDGKYQLTGISLHVNSLADVKVLKSAAVNPWSLPLTPMDTVLGAYHVKNLSNRVTVSGTITYFQPGSAAALENGNKSIWIKTDSFAPLRIGDLATVTGFPGLDNGFLILTAGEVHDTGASGPVTPTATTPRELATGKHLFDLVSIEGRVVMEAREAAQDEYVLVADGQLFSAILPHLNTEGDLAEMKRIPIGAEFRATGVCATDHSTPFGHDMPFNILLRTPDDLTILAPPSPLTVRNLAVLVVLLLLTVLVVGARAWFADRKIRRQLAELGYLSQRRGEILKDINKSRPLPETLERITELASVGLKGAPCWCKLTDGTRVGNRPSTSNRLGLRIAQHLIAAHSGPALGGIYAAFDARTRAQSDEDKALAMAAELATLAIETWRVHTDLVHRSEFDTLTDIQNRFSFERHLDELIEEAGQDGKEFGLVYIDLDDFKLVNDLHGHQFGDMYLQNVATRMKHQLRPGDLLARLGGDEFAALLPAVHNRVDVEEIAARLKRCFNEPFVMGNHTWKGSASFGTAIYPTDAADKDSLLNKADADMYVIKRRRRKTG